MKLSTTVSGLLTLGTQVAAQSAVEDAYRFLKPIPTGTKHSLGARIGIGTAGSLAATGVGLLLAKDLSSIITTMENTELDAPLEAN